MPDQLIQKYRLYRSFGLKNALLNRAYWMRKRFSREPMCAALTVEPVTKCNLRCALCPCPSWLTERHGEKMTLEQFESLVNQSRELTPRYNFNFACDPLMHEQIVDMVDYVHRANRLSWLNTNAVKLDRETGRSLIEAHLDYLYLSLDGLEAKSHEFYRRGSKFEQVLHNILEFIALKQRMKVHHPYIVLFTLQHRLNYDQETYYREYWSKYLGKGLDEFMFYPIHLNTHVRGNGVSQEDLRGFLPDNLSYSRYYEDEKGGLLPRSKGTPAYHRCNYHMEPTITSTGDMVICCQDVFGRHVIGNVFESGFKELWYSDRAEDLRKRSKAISLDICRNCSGRGI